MTYFSGVTFLWFASFFVFILALKPRPFVLRYAGAPIAIGVSFFFPFVYMDMSLFRVIAVFSLYVSDGEYVVRFLKKTRTRLDLLSILQSGGGKCQNV